MRCCKARTSLMGRRMAATNSRTAFCSLFSMRWPGKMSKKRCAWILKSIEDAKSHGGGQHRRNARWQRRCRIRRPRGPKLAPITRSMDAREFTLAALDIDGAHVTEEERGIYSVQAKDVRERICFEAHPDDERQLVLYAPIPRLFRGWSSAPSSLASTMLGMLISIRARNPRSSRCNGPKGQGRGSRSQSDGCDLRV